jgi:hypothetical protein
MNGGRVLLLLLLLQLLPLLLLLQLKSRIDDDLIPSCLGHQLLLQDCLHLGVNMNAVAVGMDGGSGLAEAGDVNAVSLVLVAGASRRLLIPPAPKVWVDQDAGGAAWWRRHFLRASHAVQILLVPLSVIKAKFILLYSLKTFLNCSLAGQEEKLAHR